MKVLVLQESPSAFKTKDGAEIKGKSITLLFEEGLSQKNIFLTPEREAEVGYHSTMVSNPFTDEPVICNAEFTFGFQDKLKLAKITVL